MLSLCPPPGPGIHTKENGTYPFPSRQTMRVRPLRPYSQHRKAQDERKPGHETQPPQTHGEERRVRSRRKIKETGAALEMVPSNYPSRFTCHGPLSIHSSPGQRTSLEGTPGQISLAGLAQRCQGKSDVVMRLSELISRDHENE